MRAWYLRAGQYASFRRAVTVRIVRRVVPQAVVILIATQTLRACQTLIAWEAIVLAQGVTTPRTVNPPVLEAISVDEVRKPLKVCYG